MKFKLLNIAFIITCLILLLIAKYKLEVIQNKYFKMKEICVLQADSIKQILTIIENENLIQNGKMQDCNIKNTLTNDSVSLYSLLKSTSNVNIIYRMIDTSCGSCNKKQIEVLNELLKFENLIVLSNVNNECVILRAYHLDENSLYLIKKIVPYG